MGLIEEGGGGIYNFTTLQPPFKPFYLTQDTTPNLRRVALDRWLVLRLPPML